MQKGRVADEEDGSGDAEGDPVAVEVLLSVMSGINASRRET